MAIKNRSAESKASSTPPKEELPRRIPMAMLPNDRHPGPGCSCRDCLARYPEEHDEQPADDSDSTIEGRIEEERSDLPSLTPEERRALDTLLRNEVLARLVGAMDALDELREGARDVEAPVNLPHLTDEEREALDTGGIAMEGVPAIDPIPTIGDRIESQRDAMFAVMAVIAVARDSVDREENYSLNCVLGDAYDRLDGIAGALEVIGGDADTQAPPPAKEPVSDDSTAPVSSAAELISQLYDATSTDAVRLCERAANFISELRATVQAIDEINGIEIAGALDALREYLGVGDPDADQSHPIVECIRHKLQDAKDRIERLCRESGEA
jgi:hypothetical protein